MTLVVGESWPAWHALARQATWTDGDRETAVLLFLSAKPIEDLDALREESQSAMQIRGAGVLPLLGVEPVGEGAAWVYPFRTLVSPAFFTEPVLGHRAAAELVAKVARVLADHPHPGPRVEDLLLDSEGEVWLVNFQGPLAPTNDAPGPTDGEAAAVYRLGALLARLLSGAIKPGSTAAAHDAAVRRAVIRAMSMPGAVFSDQYADWLRGMLAWDPAQRPPLSRVAMGLDALAETSGGLPLKAAVKSQFGDWIRRATSLSLPTQDTAPHSLNTGRVAADPEYAGRTTLAKESIIPLTAFGDDEHTMESEFPDPVERTPPSVLERGTIPVEVGPPVEAINERRPTLPPGFLDPRSGDTIPALAPRATKPSVERLGPPDPTTQLWYFPVAAVLTGTALVLAVWLFFG